jgi:hypothetical protein
VSEVLYATPQAYLAYLGSADAQLTPEQEAELLHASRAWDLLCNVPAGYFAAEDGAAASQRVLTANDPYELWTGAFYSTTGLVVETDVDGDRTFETVWSGSTDYFVEPNDAPYRRICVDKTLGAYAFPTGQRRVRVTALWGFSATAPAPVTRAVLLLAKRYSVRENTPEGVKADGGEHMMKLGQGDPDVMQIMHDGRYLRPSLLAGMGPA